NEIGNLYNYYLDEYDSSIIYYHKAMALNDKEWVYPSNLGRAYLNLGKLDSSAYYYWKAINLPNSNISHCFESLLDIYTNDTGDLADIEKIFIWLTTAPVSKGSLWERLGDTYF
ncbi:MAG TPA: tetratricopeptide repeat protein, partial [Chitinophagaceae bacterium]|nr:tetratricopeptide repeat protein [Chitinophagaceae bacterium]